MDLFAQRKERLIDLVDIERAQKDKLYPKGSIMIQISATRGQMIYLNQESEIPSHYAVFIPKKICGKYLFHVLESEMPSFLEVYQTGLNIQPDIFKFMNVVIHEDLETQEHIAEILDSVEKLYENEQKMVEALKDFKQFHLQKMFLK